MKHTIFSRMSAMTASPRAIVTAICMLMLISVPSASMAQRHGGERTERHENRNGSRREHRNDQRREDRKASQGKDNHRPQSSARPAHSNNGNNNNKNKPAVNGRPDNNRRPENNRRPGNNAGEHKQPVYRPGAAAANRPAPGPQPGHNVRPGATVPPSRPSGPTHNWTPGRPNHVQPGHHIHRPPVAPPPPRPFRPANFFGYNRPVPPPAWRPGPKPLFSSVLGLTFGTAINVAIDALISSGYTIDGYSDNSIYVNDAVQLNMRWPFGVLYYNNGLLAGSEFTYSSDWRDLSRYNMAYARLSALYGAPVSSYNRGGEISSTWWGPGGQYVTLRFDYRAPMSGANRFYTTLSFGI